MTITTRTAEETENLKREFLLGFNSYHIGTVKDKKFDKLNNHVFQGDGDYLVIDNRIGKFIVKRSEVIHPGLPIEFGGTKIQLKVPKIPEQIYHQIIAFFRDISKDMGSAEAFAQVYWDEKDKKYEVFIPEQIVTGASVNYDNAKNLNTLFPERYILVFECHSHSNMQAFWSGTDNGDEKETRFYGVFGKISEIPVMEKFRFIALKQEIELKREHIFDIQETSNEYPSTWKNNIKKYSYVPTTTPVKNYFKEEKEENYWDRWPNNWDDYDVENYKGRHNKDYSLPEKKESIKDVKKQDINDDIPIDIMEPFDFNMLEDHEKMIAIDTFAGSIEDIFIPALLEALVDYGHDGKIKEFARK